MTAVTAETMFYEIGLIDDDIIMEAYENANYKRAPFKYAWLGAVSLAAVFALIFAINAPLPRGGIISQPEVASNLTEFTADSYPPDATLLTVFEAPLTETGSGRVTEIPGVAEYDPYDPTGTMTGVTEQTTANLTTAVSIPAIGGSDYNLSRHYIDEVYNIYMAGQIVGQEARDDWVDNVLLKKPPKEQEDPPTLYQIIVDLGIGKEDFIAENEKYIEYPDTYLPRWIIDGLYLEDVNHMKQALKSPLALYYEGGIYTFDELSKNPALVRSIPTDVVAEYLDYMELVFEQNGDLKYERERLNAIREAQ